MPFPAGHSAASYCGVKLEGKVRRIPWSKDDSVRGAQAEHEVEIFHNAGILPAPDVRVCRRAETVEVVYRARGCCSCRCARSTVGKCRVRSLQRTVSAKMARRGFEHASPHLASVGNGCGG